MLFLVIGFTILTSLYAQSADVRNPSDIQRQIQFAGVTWNVKNGGPWGPGPNLWSDDPQSVWVDDQGRLHLALRKAGNVWYCAEVYTTEYTSYGEHRFLVEGYIDRMDKNIVLGLFVYASDTAEIDVEYAKWGDAANENVGSFTVQPYTTDGNQHSFPSPLSDPSTTHYFSWQPDSVRFASIHGHYYGAPSSSADYIEQWVYTGADIPAESESLRTHINLWLMNGWPPQDLSVLEVIISDVVQPQSVSFLADGADYKSQDRFVLQQNYPNPFNPETTIGYRLSAIGEVELSVYNILGEKIETLVHKKQNAGTYRVTFNAVGLPGGVYFYKLRIGDHYSRVKKMILLR